jgi:DNA polymerase III subunit gamma/tau
MRDALSIMDQAIASAPLKDGKPKLDGEEIRELMGTVPDAVFERILERIAEQQSAAVMEELNRLLNAGNSPSQMARQMVRYLRSCLMAKLGGEQTELLQTSSDERSRAVRSAALFGEEDLTRFLQVMLRTFDELNYRQEPRLHLELGLMKLVHLQRLLPLEQILSGLPGAAPRTLPVQASQPAPPSPPKQPAVPESPKSQPPSPFELDRQRKQTEEEAAPEPPKAPERAQIRPEPPKAVREPAQLLSEWAKSVLEPPQVTPEPMMAVPEPAQVAPESPKSLPEPAQVAPEPTKTLSEPPQATPEPLPVMPEPPEAAPEAEKVVPAPAADLSHIRDRVTAALDGQGHNTAASLLAAGRWKLDPDGAIQVEVGVKKTMLGLTMNGEAWKIVREALLEAGGTQKMTVVPGEAGNEPAGATPRTVARDSIEAVALGHPMVQQAKELFHAEVRSVLDLREKGKQ